jgi:hypothetical protein
VVAQQCFSFCCCCSWSPGSPAHKPEQKLHMTCLTTLVPPISPPTVDTALQQSGPQRVVALCSRFRHRSRPISRLSQRKFKLAPIEKILMKLGYANCSGRSRCNSQRLTQQSDLSVFCCQARKVCRATVLFGVALGTLTYLDWEVGVDYLELRRRGNPPFAFMVTHDMSSSGIGSVQTRFEYNMKEIETPRQSARGDHFLVVMKITPISGPIGEKDFDLQLYVYEADYLNNVNASLLDAAPPQRVDPFASSMSIAMLGFFVSQVRAGTTFGSVYDDIPSSLTTTPPPTTTGPPLSLPTPSTTTAAGSTSRAVSSASTTTSSANAIARTATSTTACETDSIATCSSCLENAGCKWCSTTAESKSTAGHCVESNIDGCARLTLSAPGCAIADEAAVPIAIIAGASVGGIILILLIVAIVVCLVMRARSQSKQKAAATSEMTTARESYSIAPSVDDNTYGDIRLTSVYSAAGLGTPTSSAESGGLVASSGSVSQPHYSQMEMH